MSISSFSFQYMTRDTSTAFKLNQENLVELQILALLGIKSVQSYDKAFHSSWASWKFFLFVCFSDHFSDFLGIPWKSIQIWLMHGLFAFTAEARRVCHCRYHAGPYTQMKPVLCLSMHRAMLWQESCQKSLQGRIQKPHPTIKLPEPRQGS